MSKHETHAAGDGSAFVVRRLCFMQHQIPATLKINALSSVIDA
jgi:hypothetical protein